MPDPRFQEDVNSQFEDSLLNTKMQNAAINENLPTYAPTFAARMSGALAGVATGLVPPAFMFIYTVVFGTIDSLSEAKLSKWTLGYITANMGHIAGYFKEFWLLLIGMAALGAYLGHLRREYGFAHKYVKYKAYSRANAHWLPLAYEATAIVVFPIWLFLVIAAKAEIYAKILGYNFSIWLASGFAFFYFWKLFHGLILRRISVTDRCLEHEYLIRVLLDNEPDLHGSILSDIKVTKDSEVTVIGSLKDKTAAKRLDEVILNIVPAAQGRISVVEPERDRI